MLLTISLIILAYLLGAIPFGLWIGKAFYHKDLHSLGSGNTGTTNTFRVLGAKAGIITFICDALKGFVAVLLPLLLHEKYLPAIVFGLIAVLGHTISVFDHFRGGKAVATSAGVILAASPGFVTYLLVVFIIFLLLFSMVSLASIAVAIAAFIGLALFPALHFILPHYDLLFTLVIAALALIILVRHRSNFKRIRAREENLVPIGLNLSKQKRSK